MQELFQPGTTAFSHHDTYRSLSWVEEFFSGCLEYRFQSSFCLRFSGIRLHQSPNQIHLGSFVTTPNERK